MLSLFSTKRPYLHIARQACRLVVRCWPPNNAASRCDLGPSCCLFRLDRFAIFPHNTSKTTAANEISAKSIGTYIPCTHVCSGKSYVLGEQEAEGEEDGEQPLHERQRRVLWILQDYDEDVNAAADVFTVTAGAAALESALPSTVRVVGEGYASVPYDHTELAVAVGGDGLATFFENVEVRVCPAVFHRAGYVCSTGTFNFLHTIHIFGSHALFSLEDSE